MAKTQFDPKDLERIVAYIGARNNIIKVNYPPKDEQVREGLKFKVDEYTRLLNLTLKKLQDTTTELAPKLRDAIIKHTGYFLDFHPAATYQEGPLQGTPLIYLGNIAENRLENIAGQPNLFLITRSDEQRKVGIFYPNHIQSEPIRVYTHSDVTWIDFRERLEYADDEELAFLVRSRLAKYIRSQKECILKDMPVEDLLQLRQKGEVNYDSIQ